MMIEIVPYRAEWADEFQRLASDLRKALGPLALRVDHIGSTSVPAMAAKNVIDIQITVASLQPSVAEHIVAAGYVQLAHVRRDHAPPGFSGSDQIWAKLLFNEVPGTRRANIHIRQAGRANQRFALLFRDFLIAHGDFAAAYAELKQRLASSLADENDYPVVKDPAVDLIYFAAEQWADRVAWSLEAGDR